MRTLWAVSLLCIVATGAQAQTSFTVTTFGLSAYRIDGVNNAPVNLVRGTTYTFNVTATGHPFYIKTQRITGTGSQYTSGVTNNGLTSGTLTFAVPMDAPATLHYQCSVHDPMGGTINITSPVGVPEPDGPRVAWLGPATPNPAQEGTHFRIGLPRETPVHFALFDLRGRNVRDLARGILPAGEHTIRWDGRTHSGAPAPSGLYLYRLVLADRVLTGRIVLAR